MSNQPQFTPGNWYAYEDDRGKSPFYKDLQSYRQVVSGYTPVVSVAMKKSYDSYAGESYEEPYIYMKPADAYLIEAAPEMFAVLESIVFGLVQNELKGGSGEVFALPIEVQDRIVAALSKARGEEVK